MREIKEKDIIEKIHKIYDVKEPDVLSQLDFSDTDMVPPPDKNLNRRYISAIAIYTAACLVITASLPFIIGGSVSNSRPMPGTSVRDTEVVTGNRAPDTAEQTEEPVETDAEAVTTEAVTTPEETVADETTVPDITVEVDQPAPEETEVTAAPETEKKPTVTTPVITTEKPAEVETDSVANDNDKTETEPEIIDPTPENMVHDKIDIPYTLIRYSGGWSDSLASLLECDPILREYGYSTTEVRETGFSTAPTGDESYIRVIKTKNQFDTLAAQIKDGLEADLINEGAFAEFAKDFEYFDEAYFEKYDLVFWGFGETVHGIEYKINNFEVDNNAVNGRHNFFVDDEYHDDEFWVNIVKKLPPAGEVVPADVAAENRTTELVLIAFEKDDFENVSEEKYVYGTDIIYKGQHSEDDKNMTDIDKFYYQAPYKVDVTEEEALETAKRYLRYAEVSNVYPYADGDYIGLGNLSSMYDYKCELTEWNGFPMYDISFYSRSNSSGIMYKVTLQLYANERCQKSSIVRNRLNDPRDATAKLAEDYEITERATPSVAWLEEDPSETMSYTYYEYADSTTMGELWTAADMENSEYDVIYGILFNGLPYLVFDNYSDYSKFIRTIKADYAEGSEAYNFLKDSEKYDEEYFENNVLAIVGVKNKDNSVDNRMSVNLYEGFENEDDRRISVTVESYIPGLGECENYEEYVPSEDDEIEYKMYVFEFECEEGVNYEFTYAQFYNYDSADTNYYVPYEDRKTYYVNKNK